MQNCIFVKLLQNWKSFPPLIFSLHPSTLSILNSVPFPSQFDDSLIRGNAINLLEICWFSHGIFCSPTRRSHCPKTFFINENSKSVGEIRYSSVSALQFTSRYWVRSHYFRVFVGFFGLDCTLQVPSLISRIKNLWIFHVPSLLSFDHWFI